ncbi:MAG: hypothetical protein H7319_08165 [Spirosoma sp.]|nr:hypothetical protein [Spirosoma sp.]
MEAIRVIQKPQNGRVVIDVPEADPNEELIIDVRSARSQPPFNLSLAETAKVFFDKLPKPNPNFNWDSMNVYEQ